MFNKSSVRSFARNQYRATPKVSNAWRIGLVVTVMVLALLLVTRGSAQELPRTACPNDAQTVFLTAITDNLSVLQTDVNAALVAMRGAIDTYQLACAGGTVTNEAHPNGIVGPLTFDGTLYEVTLTVPGGEYGSVEWTALEGDCDSWTLLSVSGDEAPVSETDIVEFEGCQAVFDVNVSSDEWTLTFKKLK